MATKVFVLSQRLWSRFRNGGSSLDCEACGQPLLPGQQIVSRGGAKGRGRRNPERCKRRYHAKCFERLFH